MKEKPMLGVKMTVRWDPAEKLEKVSAETSAALIGAANWWKGGPMPYHFEEFAIGKYGYKPRSPRYTARKFKKFGHRRPLVWSWGLHNKAIVAWPRTTGKERITVRLPIQGGLPERRYELFKRTEQENETIIVMLEKWLRYFTAKRSQPKTVVDTVAGTPSPGAVAEA